MSNYPPPTIETIFNPSNFPDKTEIVEDLLIDNFCLYGIATGTFQAINTTSASVYYICTKNNTLLPIIDVTMH